MTPYDLIVWRESQWKTQREAAALLGCGRRSLQMWEMGYKPVPRYIALACMAVSRGLPPFNSTLLTPAQRQAIASKVI